jgi:DNA ligase D-like protein (predicted 3'-phosphoesterase)
MPRFVIQQHDATTNHYDFRLEHDGVLKSWAVPKGPSLDPSHKRLAVPVEDHSLKYGDFEGNVGMGGGTGAVIQWDRGTYEPRGDAGELDLDSGHVSFVLDGEKLKGAFALTRTGPKRWILVKMRDEHARRGSDITAERPESVVSGRTWQDVARG